MSRRWEVFPQEGGPDLKGAKWWLLRETMPVGDSIHQIRLVTIGAGEVAGNRANRTLVEWFCAIDGSGTLRLKDTVCGDREEIAFGELNRVSVRFQPGCARALKNIGTRKLSFLAIVEGAFDLEKLDTARVTYKLFPQSPNDPECRW